MSGPSSVGAKCRSDATAGLLQGPWLFSSAAIFNAVICLSLLFAPNAIVRWLSLDPVTGSNLMILHLTAGFIGLFAVAYVLVAVDPVAFRVFIRFTSAESSWLWRLLWRLGWRDRQAGVFPHWRAAMSCSQLPSGIFYGVRAPIRHS
jgi:hypothetical protein